MENKNVAQNMSIRNATEEELHEMALGYEETQVLTAMGDVIRANPQFKDMPFLQLDENKEFQRLLREHIRNRPIRGRKQETQALHSIIPEAFYITNNKLSNEMTKNFAEQGEIPIDVIKPGKKGAITTYNSLNYEGKNISIDGRHEFTAYDRAIHNAVCSLYVAGNEVITPAMVYRAVNGMSETEKVSPQALEAVANSIDKSRFMRLRVDFREEAKARGIELDRAEIDANLLEARRVIIKSGGKEIDGYKIFTTPALYEYSQHTMQILSVPSELLDTKEATRNTEEMIAIREYLIRRIEVMKHDKTMSNRILYDTIFEEVGIAPNKVQKGRMRGYITSVLDLWKEKEYIEDYKEYKAGNSVKGIELRY